MYQKLELYDYRIKNRKYSTLFLIILWLMGISLIGAVFLGVANKVITISPYTVIIMFHAVAILSVVWLGVSRWISDIVSRLISDIKSFHAKEKLKKCPDDEILWKIFDLDGSNKKGMDFYNKRVMVDIFGNDIRKPNELVFGKSLPGGKKNKIVPFKEFKFKYIPFSWTSIERYINEEGKETVVFWYDL